MAEANAGEEIEIRLDGVKVASVDALPPELKADVEKRIADARKTLAPKYAPGKLRMRINVKLKTSAAARKAAGGVPAPPRVTIDDGGGAPWLIIVVLLLAAAGAALVFVPGASDLLAKLTGAAR
jgi:hypothetical protein